MADRAALIQRHEQLTDELASQLRSRGDVRAVAIRTRAQAWWSNQGVPVTERRETCSMSTADLDQQIARMDGEVDALRAELVHIELEIDHGGA